MTPSSNESNLLFYRNTPAPNVVRAALIMFQADCERKLNLLNAMRVGRTPMNANTLEQLWLKLKATCESEELAFRLLIQTIAAELEAPPEDRVHQS